MSDHYPAPNEHTVDGRPWSGRPGDEPERPAKKRTKKDTGKADNNKE